MLGALPLITNVYSTSLIHTAHIGIPAVPPDTGSRLPCQLDSSFPVAFVGDRSRIAAKICETVEGWPELTGFPP